MTALNPKSITFFVAFVPQFMVAGEPFWPQATVLLATFVTLAAANAAMFALLAASARQTLRATGVRRAVNRAGARCWSAPACWPSAGAAPPPDRRGYSRFTSAHTAAPDTTSRPAASSGLAMRGARVAAGRRFLPVTIGRTRSCRLTTA